MYRGDSFRFRKRLNISSLKAAICNVALFKSMKEREFKDQIYISYSEEGVILEASSEEEWERASRYVDNFLKSKKMALLAYGYEKQVYEQLIVRGLKDISRRMKDPNRDGPYINIIHYQKLRKSCEYMDKQHYLEPLKDWDRKYKKNPNFAFLIVEPAQKFEEVKKGLLEHILKKDLTLEIISASLMEFLLLFFTSSIKDAIKDQYEKTYIETSLECTGSNNPEQAFKVRIVNYVSLKFDIDYRVVSNNKSIAKLGLDFISSKEIESQLVKVKNFLIGSVTNSKEEVVSSTVPFQQMHQHLMKKYGSDYCVIPFKKSEKDKYAPVINKFVSGCTVKNVQEVYQHIQKNIVLEYDEIEFLYELNSEGNQERGYKIFKACINDCPFMIHEYANISLSEVETFLLYLEQLRTYYCTYLVRFYGIAIHQVSSKGKIPADMTIQQKIEGTTYYLIFDYHHRTFQHMIKNDLILDNFQIGQIILQLLYLINFLHTHEEPRSLGSIKIDETYWPLGIVLPYLNIVQDRPQVKTSERKRGSFITHSEGFEGDVRLAGLVMKLLLQGEVQTEEDEIDDHFSSLLQQMLTESKYERISLPKCISALEKLLFCA